MFRRCQLPAAKNRENFFVTCYGVTKDRRMAFVAPYATLCETPGKSPYPKASPAPKKHLGQKKMNPTNAFRLDWAH